MGITVTEKAAEEIQRVLEEQNSEADTALRVGVSAGGCSGFQYALKFENSFNEETDHKEVQHGVTIITDKKSALYLDGTTLDFYDGLDQRGFKFDNPNATKSCGCGSSFQV